MTYPLTAELGKLVGRTRFTDVPSAAVEAMTGALVDTVGVMIAGSREPAPTLLRQMLQSAGREATLVGPPGRASAAEAAWINGTAAHALDYDDVAQRGGHASAVLLPAILAQAEASGASGRDLVLAYVVGYEVFTEVASRDADQHHDKGWHPTPVFGALGAAAACASLLRLDAGQSAMAIALAASQAGGLMSNFGTMTKPFHAGRAAHAGVVSARLAAAGFTAAMDALEHTPGFLQGVSPHGRVDLERPVPTKPDWALLGHNRLAVKKYPMCYCTHRVLDGALDLVAAVRPDPNAVRTVTVTLSRRNAQILRNHAPVTGLEAKFSAEFAIATSLVRRRAGLAELQDEFVQSPEIQALMKKVVIKEDTRDDPQRPGYAIHDRVVVAMQDGTLHDSGPISVVRGDPQAPLTRQELWLKFDDCVRAGAPGLKARELFEALLSLPDAEQLAGILDKTILHVA